MRWAKDAAVDANWHTIVVDGKKFYPKKIPGKVTRTAEMVYRIGDRNAQARTVGTVKVEDMTLEFDFAAGVHFLSLFGVNDFNPLPTDLAGRPFEMLDIVADPRVNTSNVGSVSTIYRGCEVMAIETSTEQTNGTPDSMNFTISALTAEQCRGVTGGGVRL